MISIEALKERDSYHSLTVEDFSNDKKPQAITRWIDPQHYPTHIGRADYASFLAMSFGIAKGQPRVQNMYTGLILVRTGFDGYASNLAFQQAGGWHCFSQEEQLYLTDCFNSVGFHEVTWPKEKYTAEWVFANHLIGNVPYVLERKTDLHWLSQNSDELVWQFLARKVEDERRLQFMQTGT